ncbi:MAG: hypothetical protein HY805_02155 [Nitrospirae bacterium]|nr:hypothetical protein [Nitrospirota bacterium]
MKKILFIIAVILLLPIHGLTYEKNIHWEITKNAINRSIISDYLKNNLGISLDAEFDKRSGRDWIKEGSRWEDDAPRWLHHFYDPTTGQGLNYSGITYGKPSLQWGKSDVNNAYNWNSARDYYYLALTNTDSKDRESAFAHVFRRLGQIIHLIQDIAVPAHTRNDPHPYYFENILQQQRDMYEKYTRDAVNKRIPLKYDGYLPVDNTTFNNFDTFWVNNGKGLAEFTNRNFLSRNTNIDDGKYTLPVSIGEWVTTETINDPDLGQISVEVRYLQGYVTDNYRPQLSAPLTRLSAYSYFDFEMNQLTGQRVYSLNDYIHKDYSDFLIPRAVGYSAGLLDYFFRSEIDMKRAPNPGWYIIKNLTSEPMSGTFELHYDDINNERHKIANWTLNIPAYGNESVSFQPPSAPETKTEGEYILVFSGTMGEEQDAIVGKKVLIGCEPTITIVNEDGTQAKDTMLRNQSNDYKVVNEDGSPAYCSAQWSVSATQRSVVGNSTITEDGVLTAGSTACGTLVVTANCSDCGIVSSQQVRITDAGTWSLENQICRHAYTWGACPGGSCYVFSGGYRYRYDYGWYILDSSINANCTAGCWLDPVGSCPYSGTWIFSASYLSFWRCY